MEGVEGDKKKREKRRGQKGLGKERKEIACWQANPRTRAVRMPDKIPRSNFPSLLSVRR